ncbi:MAG: hypothetical protein AAF226_18445, partial [Verrucomicrobiota bacterium]
DFHVSAEGGAVVVQPASAPSYVMIPREHSLGGGGGVDGDGGGGGGASRGAGAARVSRNSSRDFRAVRGKPF